MAKHEDLYPLLLTEAPGCPTPTLRLMLNRAAFELCDRGLAWAGDLEPVAVEAGQWIYDLDASGRTAIVVLNSVKLDGRDLNGVNDARNAHPWGVSTGDPVRYRMGDGVVMLDPVPNRPGVLTINAAFAPTLTADRLPDVLVSRHFECVIEGAKAFLKRMPNQPWSDPAGAALCYSLFQRKIDEARIDAEYGQTVGSLSVKPRRFGA